MAKKLLVVDISGMANRFYDECQNTLADQKADYAVAKTLQSFQNAIALFNPTHCLLAFEPARAPGGAPHSWRETLYPELLQPPMPSGRLFGLRHPSLVRLRYQLVAQGWATAEHVGYSVSDTVASAINAGLEVPGLEVIALTEDERLVWLHKLGAVIIDPFGNIRRDEAWSLARYRVPTSQLMDALLLGLFHNDPAGLLAQQGSLEGVLISVPSMPRHQADNLPGNVSSIRRMRAALELHDYLFDGQPKPGVWPVPSPLPQIAPPPPPPLPLVTIIPSAGVTP